MVKLLWVTRKVSAKRAPKGRTCYDPNPILNDLPWHCGQTYYHQFQDNKRKYIQIGDDYSHYWDEVKSYNELYLVHSLEKIITEFIEHPQIKNILKVE